MPATHHIDPIAGNLHGAFSRDIAPALVIDPGDTVIFRTLDAGWNLAPRTSIRYEDHPSKFAPIPTGWVTFGLHADLNQAALLALEDMVDLMMARDGLTRHQALGLASVLVDLRVTQMVNEVRGVHAVLAHGAYARV